MSESSTDAVPVRAERAAAPALDEFLHNDAKSYGFHDLGKNAQGYPEYEHSKTGIRMVLLPGGTFRMGSPENERGSLPDERPQHNVTLSAFLIGKYEVTQLQWRQLMPKKSSWHRLDNASPLGDEVRAAIARLGVQTTNDFPADEVRWDDAKEFCSLAGLSLPSEAQWEYACRAGREGPYGGTGKLDDMGWYADNSDGTTRPAGRKQPNSFGLHDMHGNVWEWCEDYYHPTFYQPGLFIT